MLKSLRFISGRILILSLFFIPLILKAGTTGKISGRYLRSWCPCAMCQGHAPEAKYLGLTGQELMHVEGVGNYAISLTWQDGHNTGIYSFRLLRQLCPCPACGGEKLV